MVKNFKKDKLEIEIYFNREEIGISSADYVETIIKNILKEKNDIRMVFAAAPSQNEFLKYLISKNIDWPKITAFHMDEYIGLANNHDQLFSKYLDDRIFSKVPF